MTKAGVPPSEVPGIVQAARSFYDLRRVRQGQEYRIFSSPGSPFDSLHFALDAERILKVTRKGSLYQARIDTVPYETLYQVTTGVIEQSLFVSLQRQGADPALASELAEIFGWVVDFFKDLRRGDSYTVLYTKKVFPDGRSALGPVLAARLSAGGRTFYAFRFKPRGRSWGYYDLRGHSVEKALLRAPLKYTRITSSFRRRRYHPLTHTYRPHLGVDYAAPYGTPVHATGDGVVVAATRNRANGNYVKIRHNSLYTTYYLHLSRFARGIRKGKRVRQGQVIGYVGATGYATGPHLDYRVKVRGRFVNPRTLRLPSRSPVPRSDMARFTRERDAFLLTLIGVEPKEERTLLVEKPRRPWARATAYVF